MIRVLVVEDDPLTAELHAEYVKRIDGFEVVAVANTATAALAAVVASRQNPIDLILLDMNLPDAHGLEIARRLRSARDSVDIIAITAVRDMEVVRNAVSLGVVQYLIKPFTFATFREKLSNHLEYRRQLESAPTAASQAEVDTMLAALRTPASVPLPKGLSGGTLDAVAEHLQRAGRALSAAELAEPLSLSRVTARRYLDHLVEAGRASKVPRYGTPGRPELEYRWSDG